MKKMNRSIRKIGIGLAAGITALALTACGGAGKVQSGDDEDFTGKTLTVGIWGGNDAESAGINQVKEDFEKKTGATVELKVYTDYNTQIQADFIGKTAPDVFYIDGFMFPFYSSLGVMEPLSVEEMEADKYYSNLIETFTNEEGELLCLPKDVSTLTLYYNQDMLEACGYTADDIPSDWEDYISFLPEFQKKLDQVYGEGNVCAMTYNQDLARNLHLLERDGGQISSNEGKSTLGSEAVVKNLEFIISLVDTGAYKTPADLGLGWNGEVFGTGKCAIMEEGNWVYGTLVQDYGDIKFGVKDMPAYKGEKSSMSFTVGYGIYTGSKNKALAKEWIRYACGLEGMKTWCSKAGCLPSRADVAEAMDVKNDPVWAAHLAQETYAIPWQKGINLSTINDNYKNFLPAAIKHEVTVQEAMDKADKQANSQIENAG